MQKAKLIVFDLDYTLWPLWVDTHVHRPLQKKSDNKVYDAKEKEVKYYEDVPKILQRLKDEGYILAVASRTDWPDGGQQLIDMFGWNDFFTYKQLYPGSKCKHFEYFHQKSGIPYKDMLFFDDEYRNIVQIGKLGVTTMTVDSAEGLSERTLNSALKKFANKKD
ncbi:Magnesium-dependent phosphatase 1 [Nymphon striatum]|nr:Magnesium-dependent phosphatase 1 [Nymphon striatum]